MILAQGVRPKGPYSELVVSWCLKVIQYHITSFRRCGRAISTLRFHSVLSAFVAFALTCHMHSLIQTTDCMQPSHVISPAYVHCIDHTLKETNHMKQATLQSYTGTQYSLYVSSLMSMHAKVVYSCAVVYHHVVFCVIL